MSYMGVFLRNTALATEKWGCAGAVGGANDDLTSCKTGKTAVANYFIFCPGITDSAVYGTSFQLPTGGPSFRLAGPITQSFGAINFPVHLWLINRAAYAHAGRTVVQLYRSTVALPTAAQMTAILGSPNQSGIITFAATAGQALEDFWQVVVPAFSLTNEYLWLVVNWLITTAGGNANAGVKLRVNGANGSFVDCVI